MRVAIDSLRLGVKQYISFFIPEVSSDDIMKIADHYLIAEMAGIKTHGLSKLLWDVKYFQNSYRNTYKRVSAEDNLYSFDMHGMIGALGMSRLCEFIKNSNKSLISIHFKNLLPYGSLFSTAYTLSLDGYCSIIFNNTDKFMSSEGGKDLLGTNPICLCFASDPPVILDMATSKKSISYIFNLKENGNIEAMLPKDTYLDKDKKYTTDPALAKYVVSEGGYKGLGLSLMIELFSRFLIKNQRAVESETFFCSGMVFAFKTANSDFESASNFIRSLIDRYPSRNSFTNLKMAKERNSLEIDENVYNAISLQKH